MSTDTAAIVDGVARVLADAIDGYVFAAGITAAITGPEPNVVPIADDFAELGFPAVLCTLGPWTTVLQPGNERLHVKILGSVWRERRPLADGVQALYADRDKIADAVIARTKGYLADPTIQSVVLEGGPGIVPQTLPAKGQAPAQALVTLPFTLNVTLNRSVVPQPA